MTVQEAVKQLTPLAEKVHREKTDAASDEFERAYAEIQKQLTNQENDQLFDALFQRFF